MIMLVVLAAFLFVLFKYVLPWYLVALSTTAEVFCRFVIRAIALVMCVVYKIQGRDVDMRA